MAKTARDALLDSIAANIAVTEMLTENGISGLTLGSLTPAQAEAILSDPRWSIAEQAMKELERARAR